MRGDPCCYARFSSHGGSVCGSIGFERSHNPLLAVPDPDAFADALLEDASPRPHEQERIVAASRSGTGGVPA